MKSAHAPCCAGPRKDPPIEHRLACSLEELYKGSTRKMKIQRTIVDASGQSMRVSEVLTVDVKPGWKSGTKITFPEKGKRTDSRLFVCPSDAAIEADEKEQVSVGGQVLVPL